MNLNRLWLIGFGLVVIVIGAAGYFLGIQPALTATASANDQRVQVENQNQLHRVTLQGLQQEAERLPELQAALEEARLSIPASANFSSFLQGLSDRADAAGVVITSFSTQDAQPFVPAPELSEVMPASLSADQFVTIPIQIEAGGDQPNILAFIDAVQNGDRMVFVGDLRVDRDDGDGEEAPITTTQISGMVYVLLDAPGDSVEGDEATDDTTEAAADE